jgi:hypothetical protein
VTRNEARVLKAVAAPSGGPRQTSGGEKETLDETGAEGRRDAVRRS